MARPTSQTRAHPAASNATHPVVIARWRVYVLLTVALLVMGRIVLRLCEVQVASGGLYATLASNEINQERELAASRGMITDRFGNVLAMDIERESLAVVPGQIAPETAPQLALALGALLQQDPQELQAKLTNYERRWVPLARWLEPTVAEQIAALGEPGLHLTYEPRRIYPQEDFAAHIIGAVNFNGDGISGVEAHYNQALQGTAGMMSAEFDGARNPIAIAPQEQTPPRDGSHLTLTLDPMVQHVLEQELADAVQAHNADGGSIVVLEVATGAIRGMASWPTFDPNRYTDYPEDIYTRNPAIGAIYEPGSTFKMVTAAAGMETRAYTADTQVNDTGTIYRHDFALSNWNHAGNGMIDPGEMLYYSSNVGASLLNELTGPENFYRMIEAFGFGQLTGVDMGGEQQGLVNSVFEPGYNDVSLLTNSYGQGISATPLQMTLAAAIIANDGIMMRPYIVEQRCEHDGTNCRETQPQEVRRVLEPGVAWTVRRMLVESANHYAPVVWANRTGSFADQWLVPGYQVAAKTGTASIPLPGGGYDPRYTIGSVLGFAPAEEARYAILVKIDRPKDDVWGVRTAVPLFYTVVDQLMRYERIAPDPNLFSPGQTRE